MVQEAEKSLRTIINQLPKGDRQRDFLLPHLREIEVHALLPYLDFDRFPKTEAEIKEELARQADRYIEFGLNKHPKIKLARAKFKDSLVAFAALRPEKFADGLSLPLAVLGQVPPKDVYTASGFDYFLNNSDVRDWPGDPYGYRTPQRLYLARMVDTGIGNLNKKVEAVRANLAADLRGATEADGSGFIVAHPRILEHHYSDLPGTRVGLDRAPCLALFSGGPEVDYLWVGGASPRFGSALCGRD